MLFDEKMGKIRLSIGELVALSLHRYASEVANDRDNDILTPMPPVPRAGEHSIPVIHEFFAHGHDFVLTGEAQGDEPSAIPGLPPCVIVRRAIPSDPEYPSREILRRVRGEAFGLAYLFIKEHDLPAVRMRVILSCPAQGKENSLEETVTRAAAEKFFSRLTACLAGVAAVELDRVRRRMPTLRSLAFPYKVRREAQNDLVQAAWHTIRRKRRLFVCAPTGTGKTAGVLYPALRALGEGDCERVFYLTPKTTTARAAAEALERFAATGAELRAVILSAKERICTEGMACREPLSPCRVYAAGGEREEAAARALFESAVTVVTEREIKATAAEFGVCPYELSLRYSMLCDVIICDYNYLFDTRVYLRRYFDRHGRYVFLVDEAHELPERARDMYSASLSLSSLDGLLLHARTESAADKITAAIKELRALFMSTMKNALSGERSYTDPDGTTHSFASGKEAPYELMFAASRAAELGIVAQGDRTLPLAFRRTLASLCYPLRDFAARANLYDGGFETFYIREGEEFTVSVRCLDPAAVLDSRLSLGDSAVLFSATLTPPDYYRAVLGGNPHDEVLLLDSPFEAENLCVAVLDTVSTRFASRTESAPAIAEAIYAMVSAKTGNYFVFCPSFAYMDEVCRVFHAKYPAVRLRAQIKGGGTAAREEFLSSFVENPTETLVGFCVTGGVFAEGIDLVGTRLIGAAVVGVAMPNPTPEREAMSAYYADRYEAGREFAYLYPGMNRVLQAAGRVIRTEGDRGTLLLIDDRFGDPFYRSRIPAHWRHLKFVGDAHAVSALFRRFWQEKQP
ncbi:MAG: ATP-dependent DNA helicase [Clostridia bacterium]|nr:ATP-dependent DNA helicase [Clostridia bacterium]